MRPVGRGRSVFEPGWLGARGQGWPQATGQRYFAIGSLGHLAEPSVVLIGLTGPAGTKTATRRPQRETFPFFLSQDEAAEQIYHYGLAVDGEFGRNGPTAPAGGRGRLPGVRGLAGAPPSAAAAHGRLAPRPAAPRPRRRLRRDPGS